MENIIEQLIADFHEKQLPSFFHRQAVLPLLPRKADTVIGMRRSGKTWFLFQCMSELLEKGVPKESMLYLNLEDERLLPLKTENLTLIPEVFYRRHPENKNRLCYLFFDEIQNADNWEKFVRRLLDSENVQICLTGSSAKLLSKEIATSLRGRGISTEIFPCSVTEALSAQGIALEGNLRPGGKLRAVVENRFRKYLTEGGFPEVLNMAEQYRIRILQDYLDVVILRDLVERHGISNTASLRNLIRYLMDNNACLFSVNKFYNDLKSQGIACGKNTLHEYMDYMTDAFLFFQVRLYSKSERARSINPRKIYAIDPGLVRACSRNVTPDWGHLLENVVFLELRRRGGSIDYYRTARGREVDFLKTDMYGAKKLIQVCASFSAKSTRNREISALTEAMDELGIETGTIVTLSEEESIETECGKIHAIPAWLWIARNCTTAD